MIIKIHFDGACHNKPGENNPMGVGIAVFMDDVYQPYLSDAIHAEGLNGELGTSNIAEWKGCVEAMRKAYKLKLKHPQAHFSIFSDSELITNQFNGIYEVKKIGFQKYYLDALLFAKKAGIKEIVWISRDKNKEADKLSKEGLKNCI